MTATASYVKARAEVRLITALTDYRYFRGQWREARNALWWGVWSEVLRRDVTASDHLRMALVARERWNTLTELLSDPDWSSLRANGLDADDLALLTRDGAA